MLLGLNFSNQRFAVIDNSRGYPLPFPFGKLAQPNPPRVPEERVQRRAHEWLPLPREKLKNAGNAGSGAEPRGRGSLRVLGELQAVIAAGPSSPGGFGSQEGAAC